MGVGLGEGEATLAYDLGARREELVHFDDASEGVGGDLVALQETALDARAVDGRHVGWAAAKRGQHALDGLEELLGLDLAGEASVAARRGLHRGDAVLLVARVPGLDGGPGELEGLSALIGEDHLAHVLDARDGPVSGRELDGAQDAPLEVGADSLHHATFLLAPPTMARTNASRVTVETVNPVT